MSDKDEALRLAEILEQVDGVLCDQIAAMLRSQHARISDLEEGARVLFTRITELESVARVALEALSDVKYGLEGARIWNGMDWTYNPLHPFKYLPLRDKADDAIASLRKTLGEA